jgi:hypothetical protein
VVRRCLDEVARLVSVLVHRLSECLGPVFLARPLEKGETPANDPTALEEEDEVVQPVDEERLHTVRLAGELVALLLGDGVESAEQVEQRHSGGCEQLRPVQAANDETDVGLVLEGLPAQV